MSDLKIKFFKIFVHLSKLQAKCNKVQCRSHAKAQIEQQILQFLQTPQLKKNVATFNSQVEFARVSFTYDNQDNYYEDKYMLVIIQLVTQGVVVKIGQANINLSKILNSKKFSIPTTYPLNKCYDKGASIKLSVQFQQITNDKPIKNLNISNYNTKVESSVKTPKIDNFERNTDLLKFQESYQKPQIESSWVKSRYKSKIAEQQNTILHTKIQQYEGKLQKIINNQHYQQEKFQQQVQSKDEKINQLQASLKKTKSELAKASSELENARQTLNRLQNVHGQQSRDKQKFSKILEQYRLQNRTLKQENQSLKAQVNNLQTNKEVKDKHYKAQMEKYSTKFMESQHQKNLFVLEMETRIKQEKDRLQKHYKNIIKTWQAKVNELNQTHKDRFINIQAQIDQHLAVIESQKDSNLQLSQEISQLNSQLEAKCLQCDNLKSQLGRLNIKHLQTIQQLELVPQTLLEKDNYARKLRDEINEKKDKIQQLSNELNLASGTINQLNRKISKQRAQMQALKQSLKQRQQYKIFSMDQYIKNLQDQLHNVDQKLNDAQRQKRQLQKRKQAEVYELRQQIQVLKIRIQGLQKEVTEGKRKQQILSEELKIAIQNNKILVEQNQTHIQSIKASQQLKQLERLSQIKNLQYALKENQYRINLIETTNSKQKKSLEETSHQLEETLKKYNALQMQMESVQQARQRQKSVAKRMVQDLEENLTNKNIQIEQLKFTLQAKIMNLQQQLKNPPSAVYNRRFQTTKVEKKLF